MSTQFRTGECTAPNADNAKMKNIFSFLLESYNLPQYMNEESYVTIALPDTLKIG
jgi:hypothetical protein